MADLTYTAEDHRFREQDSYAAGKYELSRRWLRARHLPGRRLLNVGCGGGLFNRLATDDGFAVEACEPDPEAAALANASAPDGVVVHQVGLLDLHVEQPADAIVLHDVLEHIEDDAAAVAHLDDLLADGGMVILSVPALPRLYGLHDELLGHYRRYTKRTLCAVLAPRFEIEEVRWYGMLFIPITWWFSRVRRVPYPAASASTGLLGRAFRAACDAEARLRTPIGTSLICRLRKRSSVPDPGPASR
jgi:2-polyprenyl-3-methyl-5-hydroxy-6-metoxy-1,4-benzoquinol methylase